MRKQTESAKKDLFMRVRCHALVAVDDIREAVGLGVDPALLWSAAGAGLAVIHRRVGIAPNIEELRGEFPDEYLSGYYAEQISHKIDMAQGF